MNPRSIRFKQSDITRAFKGAQKAGVAVKVEIDARGTMHLVPIGAAPGAPVDMDRAIDGFKW